GGPHLRDAPVGHVAAMATFPETRRVLTTALGDAIASDPGQDMNSIASVSESSPRARLTLKQVHFRWLITLAVASGAIMVFFPFFWMAVTSLKTAPEIQRVPLQIAPDNWLNLHNYLEVFKREPFMRYLLNSAIVSSIAALCSVVVSSLSVLCLV